MAPPLLAEPQLLDTGVASPCQNRLTLAWKWLLHSIIPLPCSPAVILRTVLMQKGIRTTPLPANLLQFLNHCRCYPNRRLTQIKYILISLSQTQSLLLQFISQSLSANMQFSKLALLASIAYSVTAQTVSISDLPTCAVSLPKSLRQLDGFLVDSLLTNM